MDVADQLLKSQQRDMRKLFEYADTNVSESQQGRKHWLGRQDSNLRMPASKAGALPLGDAPTA
jgi:hypothetical protein